MLLVGKLSVVIYSAGPGVTIVHLIFFTWHKGGMLVFCMCVDVSVNVMS